MRFYAAPMEGITGYVFRNAHHRYYPGIDRYVTPFIVPNQNRSFGPRDRRDVLPEHNEGFTVIPQILTSHAGDFIKAALELKAMGYEEVNLNLGCPSKTVVTKGRGAGFLADIGKLETFLTEIYEKLDMKISVKTRIGISSPDEWEDLMKLYNKFRIEVLIIHPRSQQDYYKNQADWKVFGDALKASENPVCYNGDIFTVSDYEKLKDTFLPLQSVMVGRGLVADPQLVERIQSKTAPDKERLQAFHDEIYAGYQAYMSGERDVLFRMKELWFYLSWMFTDREPYIKKIRKSQRADEYENAVARLFREQELTEDGGFQPVM